MTEDWAIDVKKYVPDADDAVIAAIVRYCGIALRKRDSSLVSFSDPKETGRVRDNYCRKKLGLTDPDDAVDAEIAKIGERMKGDTTRNRVTVYYLLAEAYDKLGLFGGAAKAATAAPLAAVGGVASASVAAAPLAAAGGLAAANPAPAGAPDPAPAMVASPTGTPAKSEEDREPTPPHHASARASGSDGFGGIALATLAGLGLIVLGAAVVTGFVSTDLPPTELPAYAGPDTSVAAVAAAPAPAVPEGSGVTAQVVDGMPKVSVYFDTGKTDIAPDFATVAGPVKAWVDANPGDRIGVSGFNDPTGNAALNAELSKNRAQAVAAALGTIGVPADRIDLDKPPETTDASTDMSQARRVDIFVKDGG